MARFAGHVAKFVGDGVLCYFGWPRAHEDEAERAVQVGLAITEAVGRLETPARSALAAKPPRLGARRPTPLPRRARAQRLPLPRPSGGS